MNVPVLPGCMIAPGYTAYGQAVGQIYALETARVLNRKCKG